MNEGQQTSWADIRAMFKARLIELFDLLAIIGALIGLALLAVSMTGVGFLIGADIALGAIAIAVVPNVLAQAIHRLYDE